VECFAVCSFKLRKSPKIFKTPLLISTKLVLVATLPFHAEKKSETTTKPSLFQVHKAESSVKKSPMSKNTRKKLKLKRNLDISFHIFTTFNCLFDFYSNFIPRQAVENDPANDKEEELNFFSRPSVFVFIING
jgi:hypothetical protein